MFTGAPPHPPIDPPLHSRSASTPRLQRKKHLTYLPLPHAPKDRGALPGCPCLPLLLYSELPPPTPPPPLWHKLQKKTRRPPPQNACLCFCTSKRLGKLLFCGIFASPLFLLKPKAVSHAVCVKITESLLRDFVEC